MGKKDTLLTVVDWQNKRVHHLIVWGDGTDIDLKYYYCKYRDWLGEVHADEEATPFHKWLKISLNASIIDSEPCIWVP